MSILLLTALPAVAIASTTYTVTDLGTLGGETKANAISSNGLITGSSGPSLGYHAFLYSDAVMTDLGTLSDFTMGTGNAVNDAGQVVGEYYKIAPGTVTIQAVLYANGKMTDLGISGPGSFASAINNAGQIAGSYLLSDGQTWHGFLYSDGKMTDLGTLGGTGSQARAINASGHVAGVATLTGDTVFHAFLYSDGQMHDLGPGGEPMAMNSSDQITGITDDNHAFLYSDGMFLDLGTLGGALSSGYAINDNGDVVGDFLWTDNRSYHAFLYSHGAMTDLNTLIDPLSNWTLSSALGINNLGQIVGYGTNPQGQPRAFLLTPLTPTPEPTTAASLLLATTALLLRRRKHP
jgi:probable HAF family extracellular repeat protein